MTILTKAWGRNSCYLSIIQLSQKLFSTPKINRLKFNALRTPASGGDYNVLQIPGLIFFTRTTLNHKSDITPPMKPKSQTIDFRCVRDQKCEIL